MTVPSARAEGAGRSVRTERLILAGAVVWATVLTAIRWPVWLAPSIRSESSIDSAVFVLAGDLIRRGGAPYVSYWDHKAPLLHLLDAFGLTLAGGRVWGVWLVSAIATAGSAMLAWLVMRRAFNAVAAMTGLAFLLVTLGRLLPLNMAEGYLFPLQWATAFVVVAASSDADEARMSRRMRSPFVSGVAVGVLGTLAFLLRANLIGAAASAVIVLAIGAGRRYGVRGLLGLIAGGALGTILTLLPFLGWIAWRGASSAFVEQALRYNTLYSAATWGERIHSPREALPELFGGGALMLGVVCWLIAAWRALSVNRSSRSTLARACALFATVWVPIELVLATTAGRPYPHYYTTLFAPFAFSVALAVTEVVGANAAIDDVLRSNGGRVVGALTLVLLLAGVRRIAYDLRTGALHSDRADQVTRVAAYVRAATKPNETIFIWGHAADVYFLSDRRPASRYIYPLPLLTPGYADSTRVAAFVGELVRARPSLIIEASGAGLEGQDLTPRLDRLDTTWRYPAAAASPAPATRSWWRAERTLAPFYEYVSDHYAPVDTLGSARWVVYRRR
jgi:hypothetical protein